MKNDTAWHAATLNVKPTTRSLMTPPPKFAVEVVVGCSRNANHAPIDEQIDSFQPQAFTCTWCGSKATEVAAKPPKWQQSHSRSTKGDE